MQTFLPYRDFTESAHLLDGKRLGKQRVECKQIYLALTTGRGWVNHPATKMWAGYEHALVKYSIEVCRAWQSRGYADSLLPFFLLQLENWDQPRYWLAPPWLGDERFHASHRSNLLRKYEAYYRAYWPDDPADLPYLWPILDGQGGYTLDLSKSDKKKGVVLS